MYYLLILVIRNEGSTNKRRKMVILKETTKVTNYQRLDYFYLQCASVSQIMYDMSGVLVLIIKMSQSSPPSKFENNIINSV